MESGDLLNQLEPLIAEISKRLHEMDGRLDKIAGVLDKIVQKLDDITETLDRKPAQTGGAITSSSDEIQRRLIENERSRQELISISNFLKNRN